MPPRAVGTLLRCAHTIQQAQSTFLFPFLYQTQTIIRALIRNKSTLPGIPIAPPSLGPGRRTRKRVQSSRLRDKTGYSHNNPKSRADPRRNSHPSPDSQGIEDVSSRGLFGRDRLLRNQRRKRRSHTAAVTEDLSKEPYSRFRTPPIWQESINTSFGDSPDRKHSERLGKSLQRHKGLFVERSLGRRGPTAPEASKRFEYEEPASGRDHATQYVSSNSGMYGDIPFEDQPPEKGTSQSERRTIVSDPSRSTITGSERAVFDSIFKSLAKHAAKSDDFFDDDLTTDGRPAETLEDIFNAARKNMEIDEKHSGLKYSRSQKDKSTPSLSESPGVTRRGNASIRGTSTRDFPLELQLSLQQAKELHKAQTFRRLELRPRPEQIGKVGVEPERKLGEPLDAYEQLVERVRKRDLERITASFAATTSDLQVWNILNRDVFRQIRRLNGLMEEQKTAKEAAASSKKKRGTHRQQESGLLPEPFPAIETAPYLNASTPVTDTTLPKHSVHPLAILQTNYAEHLLTALQTFRKYYPTSPYAVSLLPLIKSYGTISYVLGASTALYNELIYLRWVHYRDLHSCAELVAEMLAQGIPTDGYTHAVFVDADRARRRARKGDEKEGPITRAWWGLHGVVAGMKKWEKVDAEASRRWVEEKQRTEIEKRELLEMEEREDGVAESSEMGEEIEKAQVAVAV